MIKMSPPVRVLLKLRATRGRDRMWLRRCARAAFQTRISSPSTMNHTGFGCGVPSAPTEVSQATRSCSDGGAGGRPGRCPPPASTPCCEPNLYQRMAPFAGIAGHQPALRHLSSQLESGRLAHAYLFVGEPGLGKTEIARRLAQALLPGLPLARHPDYWEDDRREV